MRSAPASRSSSAEAADPPPAAAAADDDCARRPARRPPPERVLYARSQRLALERPPVVGGEPLTESEAIALRECVFGASAASPAPRGAEWLHAGLVARAPERDLGWALAVPAAAGGACARRCSLRALLAAVQALFLRWLLFPAGSAPALPSASNPQQAGRRTHAPAPPALPADRLRPTAAEQREALASALASALWRCASERGRARVALPLAAEERAPWAPSAALLPDGVTERLVVFDAASLDDLRLLLRRFLYVFQEEAGPGCLCLLYSAVLTRGIDRVVKDLDGAQESLVGSEDEGSPCLVTLLLTGRATPYLHNGVVYVGDEDHYALPHFGVLARAEVGLLLWEARGGDGGGGPGAAAAAAAAGAAAAAVGAEDSERQPGSRLKTPQLPVWVSAAAGHFGVLFATDRELLRNYHAERRFQLHYYCFEAASCLLGVDTRYEGEGDASGGDAQAPRRRADDAARTPVEKVICSKWEDAQVTWIKLPANACTRLSS